MTESGHTLDTQGHLWTCQDCGWLGLTTYTREQAEAVHEAQYRSL